MKIKPLILLVTMVLLSGQLFGKSGYEDRVLMLGKAGFQIPQKKLKAPGFSAKKLNGKKVKLKNYRGKIVFLNFWATWCPPCRKEMPSMEKLHNKMKGKKFVMLAVSNEEKATVNKFIKSRKFTFPVLISGAASKYGVTGIPTTFIIDEKGYLLGMLVGSSDWADKRVVSLFKKLASGKSSGAKEVSQKPVKETKAVPDKTDSSGGWKDSYYKEYTYKTFKNYAPAKKKINFKNVDYKLLAAAVFYETSRRRIKANSSLPAYKYSKKCRLAAQMHANDMVKGNFFSHTNPRDSKKRSLTQRVKKFNYGASTWGENIATAFAIQYKAGSMVSSFKNIPPHTYINFAKDLVNGWMNSPGHRANILNKRFTHLGTGNRLWRKGDVMMSKSVQVFGNTEN